MTMRAFAMLIGLLALLPGLGLACPDAIALPAERVSLTGRDLWSPWVKLVYAGGDTPLGRCGFQYRGFVRGPPDLEVELSRMARYDRLHVRANATCDTVLLLRDPLGRWWFDDDSGTGRTASLSLPTPVDGAYDIWVGSYGIEGCAARLTLETF
jgi:hypothetical protein